MALICYRQFGLDFKGRLNPKEEHIFQTTGVEQQTPPGRKTIIEIAESAQGLPRYLSGRERIGMSITGGLTPG
jgi:hypothetical protein